jgi:hypothetical protein
VAGLIINKELNLPKMTENRAAELIIANKELAFQNDEEESCDRISCCQY